MKASPPLCSLIDRDRTNSLFPVGPSPPDENHLVTGGERHSSRRAEKRELERIILHRTRFLCFQKSCESTRTAQRFKQTHQLYRHATYSMGCCVRDNQDGWLLSLDNRQNTVVPGFRKKPPKRSRSFSPRGTRGLNFLHKCPGCSHKAQAVYFNPR